MKTAFFFLTVLAFSITVYSQQKPLTQASSIGGA